MASEYQKRSSGFARKVRGRLPFYIFSKADDYHAAGGPRESAGVYMGSKLMAVADQRLSEGAWRRIQHEGFHQYVDKVLTQRIPVWVNEGMAEYFGHGVWTGDSYVLGVIPPDRLGHVKSLIKNGQIVPFLEMLEMTYQQWTSKLEGRNYDQAWAMVHFLVHADGGRYLGPFDGFILDVAERNLNWKESFVRRFGRDVGAFERRFREWWSSLPKNPTADLYTGAVVQTVASFFARAYGQGQRFEGMEDFFKAARDGSLKEDAKQWLPRKLLLERLKGVEKLGAWTLAGPKSHPAIQLAAPDGTTFTASFRVRAGASVAVKLDVKGGKKAPAKGSSGPATQPGKLR
jgi:hypothetical protein